MVVLTLREVSLSSTITFNQDQLIFVLTFVTISLLLVVLVESASVFRVSIAINFMVVLSVGNTLNVSPVYFIH